MQNITSIVEAGPPADSAFLIAWFAASVASFAVFGVLRPMATATEGTGYAPVPRPTAAERPRSTAGLEDRQDGCHYRRWLVRQLFSCSWAWLLVDAVHRTVAYVCLRPTMLWRRRMLPLPPRGLLGATTWVNKMRFLLHCVPRWPEGVLRGEGHRNFASAAHYFLAGGFARDLMRLMDLDGDDGAADVAQWATACQRMFPWSLPISGVLHGHYSAERERQLEGLRQFLSEDQREAEVQAYRTSVIVAVMVCVAIVISSGLLLVRCLSSFSPRSHGAQADGIEGPLSRPQQVPEWGDGWVSSTGGDADDSCVDSAEARAEEARLSEDATYQAACDPAPNGKDWPRPPSAMTAAVQECWPTILSCLYAGMFAYVGGMPIMMHYLFPGMIIIASLVAMVLAG